MDIVENSIRAGAKNIRISILEDTKKDLFVLEVEDDGVGMKKEEIEKALDPFYTTKLKKKKVGLGLSLLFQATKMAEGDLFIESRENMGTKVKAIFRWSHIDRKPLGDMAQTITALVATNPDIDFTYTHKKDGKSFIFDTKEVKKRISDIPISDPSILNFIREFISSNLEDIGAIW